MNLRPIGNRPAQALTNRSALDDAVAANYDSLSAEEIDDRKKWGDFALDQFRREHS